MNDCGYNILLEVIVDYHIILRLYCNNNINIYINIKCTSIKILSYTKGYIIRLLLKSCATPFWTSHSTFRYLNNNEFRYIYICHELVHSNKYHSAVHKFP